MRMPVTAVVLLLMAACGPADQKAEEAPQTEAAAPEHPPVDPAAIEALNRMGAYLRTLQSFEVRANTTLDDVLVDTNQKVQFGGEGLYRIRRPNAFYLEVNTDRRHRTYIYDGTTFTILSPRMHSYARRPAPATIAETVEEMRNRYGIPVPLADLFYWGLEPPEDMQFASHIGFARVNGQETEQYLFRQGEVDWQIWILRGERPLPVKVLFTTLSQAEQPQYTAELSWNLTPSFSDATFAFRPPPGAHEIPIAESTTAADADSTGDAD